MTDAITMVLPADSRFVATARVTTASLAAELDFSIDEIEELRIAANELVSVLIEFAEDHGGEQLHIEYKLAPDSIEMSGRVDGGPAESADPESLDQLTQQIVAAVVDEYQFAGGTARILKRRVART